MLMLSSSLRSPNYFSIRRRLICLAWLTGLLRYRRFFGYFFPGRQYYDHILNIFIVGILLHSLQPFVNPCYTWVHLSQNKYVEISTMENLNKYLATKISIESPKWESLFIFWSMVMHMFKKLICRVRNFHSVYNCQVQAQIEPKI